jgi:hypothetical protein
MDGRCAIRLQCALQRRSGPRLCTSCCGTITRLNPPSADLVRREICVTTGLLPSRFSAGKTTELFLKGTEPQQDCASWFSEKGQLLLPGEYAMWCASRDNALGAAVVPEPRITNPLPNSKYEIDPVLPRAQRVRT